MHMRITAFSGMLMLRISARDCSASIGMNVGGMARIGAIDRIEQTRIVGIGIQNPLPGPSRRPQGRC